MTLHRFHIILLTLLFSTAGLSQDNCNVFKWSGDSCRYKACHFLENSKSYFQLKREYHEIKDRALEICPEYAVVYKYKSTAYLKTGDFIGWKKLIDKAVELNPKENLDYRGWCRFQFFRDYKGAIRDIEELEGLMNGHDIGHCQNGYYHLVVAKGLCYKMLDQNEKAIEIIKTQLEKEDHFIGLYDYLHLGVLYLETQQLDKAEEALKKQLEINALAECHYYLALTYKKMNQKDDSLFHLREAKKLYESGLYMFDVYTHQVDKIFLADIEKAIIESGL